MCVDDVGYHVEGGGSGSGHDDPMLGIGRPLPGASIGRTAAARY